jgi:hypothetical protein
MEKLKTKNRALRHWVSFPFIFSCIIPLVITDLWIEIYHRICFPLYGLKYIKRSRYIRIDRQKLSYLTALQKIGCMYCGYANGVIAYWVQIAGATERYWCGIKHKEGNFVSPEHHKNFAKYGDKKDFEEKYL